MTKENRTLKELVQEALVPQEEQPYEVPGNWCWLRLGSIVQEIKNGTTITQNKDGIGARVTRIESVQDDTIDFERIGYIEDTKDLNDSNFYKPGDIALSHINSYEHVGKTAIIKKEFLPLIHGMNLLRIRPIETIVNADFLCRYMQSTLFRNDVRSRVRRAVNQVSINQKRLSEIRIAVPHLNEQKRIVEKLDGILYKLKEAKDLIEDVKKSFGIRRSSIFHKAFSGKLTAILREGHTHDKSQNVNTKVQENKWGYELPYGWKWVRLGDYIDLISGQHIMQEDYNSDEKGIAYLTGPADFGKINPVISKWTEKPKVIARKEDILITVKGSGVGKVNILNIDEAVISRQLMAIRTKLINHYYLYYYLESKYTLIQELSTGTAIPGIDRKTIQNIDIPVPTLSEQEAIVSILKVLLSHEEEIQELTDLEDQIDLIEKAILSKAFRGELGTNNPNEEKVIELLKEILKGKLKMNIKKEVKNYDGRDIAQSTEAVKIEVTNKVVGKVENENIYDILLEYKRQLSPIALYKLSGLDIEEFYSILKEFVECGKIVEIRRPDGETYLEAKSES